VSLRSKSLRSGLARSEIFQIFNEPELWALGFGVGAVLVRVFVVGLWSSAGARS
jgi:hypothetical protein